MGREKVELRTQINNMLSALYIISYIELVERVERVELIFRIFF